MNVYKGTVSEPLYSLLEDEMVSNGEYDENPSFFQEYKYKLEKIYSNFYTEEGMKIALERQKAAVDFYDSLYEEVSTSYETGRKDIEKLLN